MDITRELLLGVCKGGLRLVKLGLYDPGREEEIAFFSYSEIYEWGCCDIQTFEFCAASGPSYPYVARAHIPTCTKTVESLAASGLAQDLHRAWSGPRAQSLGLSARCFWFRG